MFCLLGLQVCLLQLHMICEASRKKAVPEKEIVEYSNSVDPDQAAHYELPHLDLSCFPSGL